MSDNPRNRDEALNMATALHREVDALATRAHKLVLSGKLPRSLKDDVEDFRGGLLATLSDNNLLAAVELWAAEALNDIIAERAEHRADLSAATEVDGWLEVDGSAGRSDLPLIAIAPMKSAAE